MTHWSLSGHKGKKEKYTTDKTINLFRFAMRKRKKKTIKIQKTPLQETYN